MAENEIPPIPEGLCGVDGCVFIAGHEFSELPAGPQVRHTWEV